MADPLSLAEQRRILRGKLLVQREVIAQLLDPVNVVNGGYPRSMTMRFLAEHSTLAGSIFSGAATLLIGARYFKTIAAAFTVFKVVIAASRQKR